MLHFLISWERERDRERQTYITGERKGGVRLLLVILRIYRFTMISHITTINKQKCTLISHGRCLKWSFRWHCIWSELKHFHQSQPMFDFVTIKFYLFKPVQFMSVLKKSSYVKVITRDIKISKIFPHLGNPGTKQCGEWDAKPVWLYYILGQ